MTDWSLSALLAGLHDEIELRLSTARKAFAHPGTKGDASENVWLALFEKYLPKRYQAAKAHVVDSLGKFSQQMDVVIFDRQYSPFIFHHEGQVVIPAESVYATFEAKQTINADQVTYAKDKIASVRRLYRTSLPIPSASGILPAKSLPHILGGILTFESDWSPVLGPPLINVLKTGKSDTKLDLGCVAAHGMFARAANGGYRVCHQSKPATAFLFELIALLQNSATVPMIDIRAYAKWLTADGNNQRTIGPLQRGRSKSLSSELPRTRGK